MDDMITTEDVLAAIESVAETILEQANLSEPPFDAMHLARNHFRVPVVASEAENVIRREMEEQYNAAQSIAKLYKSEVLRRLEIEHAPHGKSIVNLLALRLLIPTCWLAQDAPNLEYDLLALQECYSTVTHETLAWRLLDLEEPCIITIVDNGAIYRRRSNSGHVKKTLSRPEQDCRREVFQSGEPCRVQADGWDVQGWPIPHEHGARQILRSVVEPDAFFSEEPTVGDDEPF